MMSPSGGLAVREIQSITCLNNLPPVRSEGSAVSRGPLCPPQVSVDLAISSAPTEVPVTVSDGDPVFP